MNFTASPELIQSCQQFGEVYLSQPSPGKCHATGNDLEVAVAGERATAVLHIADQKEKTCTTCTPVNVLRCELVSEDTDEIENCTVKQTDIGQYEISYQPTSRGRHQLHIKVNDEHIKSCLLYTSPSPRDATLSRMPSSA